MKKGLVSTIILSSILLGCQTTKPQIERKIPPPNQEKIIVQPQIVPDKIIKIEETKKYTPDQLQSLLTSNYQIEKFGYANHFKYFYAVLNKLHPEDSTRYSKSAIDKVCYNLDNNHNKIVEQSELEDAIKKYKVELNLI